MKRLRNTLCLLTVTLLVSCSSAYYGTLEKFGIEKRDVLVDRIEDTRDIQEDAQQQFQTALEQYRAIVAFDGGDLEALYHRLDTEYRDSEKLAGEIADHIRSVEKVADDLFAEWESELELIKNPTLRRDSAKQLRDTRYRSKQLIAAMWKAQRSTRPVLDTLRDQVYYLKHNLNARAIAALRGELRNIDADVNRLVSQMQAAINEANAFIEGMR